MVTMTRWAPSSRSKPCAFAGQGLLEHSTGSYDILVKRGFLDDTYYAVVRRRLSAFDFNDISVNDVRQLIELVVKLHDIGKAAEHYQAQFDDGCNSLAGGDVSFKFHEIGSALFFYHGNYTEDHRMKKLLTLAALNHLNALRGLRQLERGELPRGARPEMLKLRKYGKELVERLGYTFEVRDYDFDDYVVMMNDLLTSNEHYLKLYNLFLAPVIVGDNLDSHYARKLGEKRRFIELLEKELLGV